jgi:hypothetical protein
LLQLNCSKGRRTSPRNAATLTVTVSPGGQAVTAVSMAMRDQPSCGTDGVLLGTRHLSQHAKKFVQRVKVKMLLH